VGERLVNRMLRISQDKHDFMLGQEGLKNICCDLLSATDGLRLDVSLVLPSATSSSRLAHRRFVSGMMGGANRTGP